jgi:SAM-dependent MidA family methyltransferase
LVEQLRGAADADGFVPFDRFMEIALYAEPGGFYTRFESRVGPGGDFYTAPHVTPLFAAAFAQHIRAIRARVAAGEPFRLVELGPGDGRLMAGILNALAPHRAEVEGMAVALVERSSALRARSLEMVEGAARSLGASVHAHASLAELGTFRGVVVANEFFDAQPARRLRRSGDHWVELGVRIRSDRPEPAESRTVRPLPGPGLPGSVEDGTTVEYSPAAEAVVREVADHLVHGAFLVDDYGMEESELVRGHPGGTLEAAQGHRAGRDPVGTPGEVDLSVFVNFSRLRAAAVRAGLTVISDRRQAETLGEWGFASLFDAALRSAGGGEGEVRLRLAVKNLLFGFERFRVLELVPRSDRDLWANPT